MIRNKTKYISKLYNVCIKIKLKSVSSKNANVSSIAQSHFKWCHGLSGWSVDLMN